MTVLMIFYVLPDRPTARGAGVCTPFYCFALRLPMVGMEIYPDHREGHPKE